MLLLLLLLPLLLLLLLLLLLFLIVFGSCVFDLWTSCLIALQLGMKLGCWVTSPYI